MTTTCMFYALCTPFVSLDFFCRDPPFCIYLTAARLFIKGTLGQIVFSISSSSIRFEQCLWHRPNHSSWHSPVTGSEIVDTAEMISLPKLFLAISENVESRERKEKETYLKNEGVLWLLHDRILPMSVLSVIISLIYSVEPYGRYQVLYTTSKYRAVRLKERSIDSIVSVMEGFA